MFVGIVHTVLRASDAEDILNTRIWSLFERKRASHPPAPAHSSEKAGEFPKGKYEAVSKFLEDCARPSPFRMRENGERVMKMSNRVFTCLWDIFFFLVRKNGVSATARDYFASEVRATEKEILAKMENMGRRVIVAE